jgi:hypothetical protein
MYMTEYVAACNAVEWVRYTSERDKGIQIVFEVRENIDEEFIWQVSDG